MENNSELVNGGKELSGGSSEKERQLTGFTRGPWEISTTEFGGRKVWPCIRGAIDQHGGWVVALMDQACVSASDDEPDANARLIAAAPALYEALSSLAYSFDERDAGNPCWCYADSFDPNIGQQDTHLPKCQFARKALALVSEQATASSVLRLKGSMQHGTKF